MPDAKTTPLHLRVFLASPGDVADERALVRRLLKNDLPYEIFLRGRVTFDIVSWDDPAAPTPMPARLTPQEAVIRFETKPSECDIVIVVLWSRLGTHLDVTKFQKADGEPYLSGTEWEFEDAWNAEKRPEVFVYWRTEKPKIELDDPDDPIVAEHLRQRRLVKQFMKRFMNPDGSFRGSVTPYDTPTAFKERLATDLKRILHKRLDKGETGPAIPVAPIWTGSPYPGLRSFTMEEGPIFYGRGREVDALIARLRDPAQRFLAVVGASGTGKSSLIRAGLIPRLQDDAIEGSRNWCVITCTPGEAGDNPFLALAYGLVRLLPTLAHKPPIKIAMDLANGPQRFSEYATAPTGGGILLFVDQLEELFTPAAAPYREAFGALLAHAVAHPQMRVVATLRADFLPQCAALPDLAPLLQAGTFVLAPPGLAALADMIRKPAERAGLVLEDSLADEILKDAGNNPGALPLMAFCLEELYLQSAPNHELTVDAYEALDRLQGAISRRVAALLEELREAENADLDAALPRVFQSLVHVDAAGTATRRRAFRDELSETAPIPAIIDQLVRGRLLAAENAGGRPTVTLAHEALLQEWPTLREWLDCNRAQLQRIQMLIAALTDAAEGVRGSAAEALGRIGPAAAGAVPALTTALGDANERVSRNAAIALGGIGPAATKAVPALITALGDANADARRSAAEALRGIGLAAVPALTTALGDANERVSRNAAIALGGIGPAATKAVPALITALGDADADVRGSAASALLQIGPVAVPALITALGDADERVSRVAAWILGWIRLAAMPALLTALGDADERVRLGAARALGQIGPAAAASVPALTAVLQDPDQEVIDAAKEALERIQSAHSAENPA